jgi:hypothetical protein
MRSAWVCLTTFAGVLVVSTSALDAQGSPPLVLGARVRVTAPTALTPRRQAGTMLALRGDSLVFQLEGRPDSVTLPMRQVTKLDVSRGEHSHGLEGMFLGALAGVAVGAVLESRASSQSDASSGCKDAGCAFLSGAAAAGASYGNQFLPLAGLLLGGIGGGIVGLAYESERWEHVPPRTAGRVSVVPAPHGGVALSLAVRF